MNRTIYLACCIVLLVAEWSHAFSPACLQTARVVPGTTTRTVVARRQPVYMTGESSSDDAASTDSKTDDTAAAPASVSSDGTYYDDEVEPAVQKDGISNSMKERLMREASTGLDSESKQSNVLLYIIGAVAVLVLLGGQGIFF